MTGGFRIENSTVCQASKIVENVVKSDYYCQTDDPEPNHPGEAGDKTLMGVDSDADGVRDDVEIWINQNTSNTANKDMYNQRMALKGLAKSANELILVKDSPVAFEQAFKKNKEAYLCVYAVQGIEDKQLVTDLQKKMYNTMSRLEGFMTTQGSSGGKIYTLEQNKNKTDYCSFNLK